MGLFRRRSRDEAAEVAIQPKSCPHVNLVPRWDNAADMGREELATYWTCGSCGQQFTPEEASELRETEAERLKSDFEIAQ
jgi:hypothetical protein